MTDVRNYILKGKYMQEIYDIVCEHPDGIKASEIGQLLPEVPAEKIGGALRRMRDAQLISGRRVKGAKMTWKVI